MVGCRLAVNAGWVVIQNPKICSGFQPEIIRQAGMDSRRVEILFSMRSHRQESVVDIRRRAVALD